jgi:hypothetical protein
MKNTAINGRFITVKKLVKRILFLFTALVLTILILYFIPLSPSQSVIDKANKARVDFHGKYKNDSLVIMVDYSFPVFMKRFWVYDLNKNEAVINTHVSHAWKSGLVLADTFSNVSGSNLSSLGVMKTGERYIGKYGPSMRIDGLEPRNNAVRQRAIVIHPLVDYSLHGVFIPSEIAFYSEGCFVLNNEVILKVRELCHDGTLIVVSN